MRPKRRHLLIPMQFVQRNSSKNLAQQAHLREQNLTQLIKTEPNARMMHTASGKKAAYNMQTAADAAHHLIVYHEVTQACTDNQQLLPIARETRAVLEQDTLTVAADAGYSNGQQFALCEQEQIEACVPANRAVNNQSEPPLFDHTQFQYEPATDSFRCPNGNALQRKQMKKGAIIYATHAGSTATATGNDEFTPRHR